MGRLLLDHVRRVLIRHCALRKHTHVSFEHSVILIIRGMVLVTGAREDCKCEYEICNLCWDAHLKKEIQDVIDSEARSSRIVVDRRLGDRVIASTQRGNGKA